MSDDITLSPCPGACEISKDARVDYVIVYDKKHQTLISLLIDKLHALKLITRQIESREYDNVYLLVSAPREVLTTRAELNGIFVPIRMVRMEDMMSFTDSTVRTSISCPNPKRKIDVTTREKIRCWFSPSLVGGFIKFPYKKEYDDIFVKDTIYDPFNIFTRIRGSLVHDLAKDIELSDVLKKEHHQEMEDDNEEKISAYRGLEWLKKAGYVKKYFVPHCQRDRDRCKKMSGVTIQSVSWIREYLGEKVGFCFAWRAAWLSWGLTVPAIFGVIVTIIDLALFVSRSHDSSKVQNNTESSATLLKYNFFDNEILPFYAIIALLLQLKVFAFGWSKNKHIYGFKWGVLNYFLMNERQTVKLTSIKDLVADGNLRNKVMSIMLGTAALLLILVYNLVCFIVQQVLRVNLIKHDVMSVAGSAYFSTIAVSILNTIFVVLFLNPIFVRFAKLLCDREYHTFHSDYERSLTWKVFFYSFVANTLRLSMMVVTPQFTVYKFVFEFCQEDTCIATISFQLLFFMFAKPLGSLVGYYKDDIIYQCKKQVKSLFCQSGQKRSDSYSPVMDERCKLDKEYRLYESDRFGERYQTLMDMNDRVSQYAFVIMFGGVCPLFPFVAFCVEIVMRKLDIKRYTVNQRRPIPRRHEGVGCWEDIIDFVNSLAMFTNVWLVLYRLSTTKVLVKEIPQIGLLLIGCIATIAYFVRAVTQETSTPEKVKRFYREEMNHAESILKSKSLVL